MINAETVSQKQASNLAQLFFNEANGRVTPPVKMVYNGRYLTTNRLFVPFYIYNNPSGGFVIISAENKTFPILGYSLKEYFNPEKLGEKEKALLTSYARDIEMIRYDSSVPESAIKAWTDFPGYISGILKSDYQATDPTLSMQEATDRIYYLIDSGKAQETASDIYSPDQWIDLINKELNIHKSVAIGLIEPSGSVSPAIIYGKKGDYYRIELDRRNQWFMRLLPSEILSSAQLADFSFPAEIPLSLEEEEPFTFLDSLISDNHYIMDNQPELSDLMIINENPVVNGIGGGHYSITIPENVIQSSVYNLSGALTNIRTYKSTNTAHIDLSPEPAGFYFALLLGESGKTYGIKLSR
ncbi:MAG: Spi family protease inhibitor [Muribaculaceae bacterium]|nr:Spi family protease inhibitor [Muribaculaceae bacterium]